MPDHRVVPASGARPVSALPCGATVRDRGSVTAETAVVLPALVLVLAVAVWVLTAVSAQLRCTDAAGLAARAAARGDTSPAVLAVAEGVAPAPARVQVQQRGAYVHVRVSALVRPSGVLLSRLPPVEVVAETVAAREGHVAVP